MSDVPVKTRISQYWHPVAEVAEVGDGPIQVRLLGEPLVLFRNGDEIVAGKDLCVHRGAPLSMGAVENGCVRCPYHGWLYDSEGRVTEVPGLAPGAAIPSAARTPVYRVEQRYGLVWVALEEPVAPIPETPDGVDQDPSFTGRLWTRYDWKTSAGRAIENEMDLAHFPYVHPYYLADPAAPAVLDVELRPMANGVWFHVGRFRYTEPGVELAPGWGDYYHTFPFTHHLLVVEQLPERELRTMFSVYHCPVSAKETRMWWFIHRNHPTPDDEAAQLQWFHEVLEQDRVIAEAVRPEEIPLDIRAEIHLKVPDAASLAFRRWMESVDMLGLAPL